MAGSPAPGTTRVAVARIVERLESLTRLEPRDVRWELKALGLESDPIVAGIARLPAYEFLGREMLVDAVQPLLERSEEQGTRLIGGLIRMAYRQVLRAEPSTGSALKVIERANADFDRALGVLGYSCRYSVTDASIGDIETNVSRLSSTPYQLRERERMREILLAAYPEVHGELEAAYASYLSGRPAGYRQALASCRSALRRFFLQRDARTRPRDGPRRLAQGIAPPPLRRLIVDLDAFLAGPASAQSAKRESADVLLALRLTEDLLCRFLAGTVAARRKSTPTSEDSL